MFGNIQDAKPTKKEKKIVSDSCPSCLRRENKPLGGLRFAVPQPVVTVEKPKREKKPKPKHDPRLVAAARELKDRWLEQVNARLIVVEAKYDVTRAIDNSRQSPATNLARLLAA